MWETEAVRLSQEAETGLLDLSGILGAHLERKPRRRRKSKEGKGIKAEKPERA